MSTKLNAFPVAGATGFPGEGRASGIYLANRNLEVAGTRMELQPNKQDCFQEKMSSPRFGEGEPHKGIFLSNVNRLQKSEIHC